MPQRLGIIDVPSAEDLKRERWRELSEPCVLRNFIPAQVMLVLREEMTDVYRHLAQYIDEFDDDVKAAQVWGGFSFGQLRHYFPGRAYILDPIKRAIEARWEGAEVVEPFSVFRCIKPDHSTYIHWHMDADGAGSWDLGEVWNCWIPLEHVGWGDYPSLEIISESKDLMLNVGPKPPGHRPDEWVRAHFPRAETFIPRMKIGDALIFSHHLLHRTEPMEKLKGPRIGLEMRFIVKPRKRKRLAERIKFRWNSIKRFAQQPMEIGADDY